MSAKFDLTKHSTKASHRTPANKDAPILFKDTKAKYNSLGSDTQQKIIGLSKNSAEESSTDSFFRGLKSDKNQVVI